MKKFVPFLLVFQFVCAPKDPLVKIDPKAFANSSGAGIAVIERIDQPFEVQKYKGGSYFSTQRDTILVKDKTGRLIPQLLEPSKKSSHETEPAKYGGQELSQELRAALLSRFVSNYKLAVRKSALQIEAKDGFQTGIDKEQQIRFYIDVQPEKWGVLGFEFDLHRYYYEYKAALRIIDGTRGAVLGAMVCHYRSAPKRTPEYSSEVTDFVYSQEDLKFFHSQPFFDDWFAKKGELLKVHTRKALKMCLEEFEEKVMSPEKM